MKYQVIRLRSFLLSAALIAGLFVFCLLGNRMILRVSTTAQVTSNKPLIMIDPGHGGEDGGTQSAKGELEKDYNLSIAQKLESELQRRGYETIMTRQDDALIYDEDSRTMRQKKVSDIHNRFAMIEAHPDCIFLSIHQNYYSDTRCCGTQVFFSPNHPQSEALAKSIQAAVIGALQPDNTRVAKQSGSEIYLLFHAQTPAVMVECGFLSNVEEAQRLLDEDYQAALAAAIADGLDNALGLQ